MDLDLGQLAEQNQLDEYVLRQVLRLGRSTQPEVAVVDDISERPYNKEWTIAVIFDLGGKRYGYYEDGAQTVVSELNKEETIAGWASSWDAEHLPDLLAAILQSTNASE